MIYVDEIMEWPSGKWCHMATDGKLSELHAMAAKIGLKRSWFQNKPRHPHYDLRPSKRVLAIQHGAQAVDSFEMIRRCFQKTSIDIELRLGQKFHITSSPQPPFTIEITKLGTQEIEFMVSGEDVEQPDKPRALAPGVFAKWLLALSHEEIK